LIEALEWLARFLALELLACGVSYAAYGVALRLLPGAGRALRWTAACVIGLWLSAVLFQLLATLDRFTLPVALFAVAAAAAGAHLLQRDRCAVPRTLADDLETTLGDLGRLLSSGWAALPFGAALACAGLIVVRAAIVPVVAWDSLTYHAVKAGLWVQAGGYESLAAPGGWSVYRTYLGGGEVLTAWAMLPLAGDLAAGLADALVWLLLGLAVFALGGQLGLRESSRWVSAAYVLALPAAARAAGSLYVDNAFALAVVAACVLVLSGSHSERPQADLIAMMALGVALGIKIFAAPLVLAMVLVLPLLRGRSFWQPRRLAWTAAGGVAALLAAGPWWVRNVMLTGLPLSPLPLSVAGLRLGEANPAMRWYMDRPNLLEAGLAEELTALGRMLGFPGLAPLSEPTLGALTVVPLLLFVAALPGLARLDWRKALVVLAFVVPMLLAFYGSGLEVTRLQWAAVSGRYLLAAAAIVVVASFTLWPRDAKGQRLHEVVLAVGAAAYVVLSDTRGWTRYELLPGLVVVALGAFVLAVWVRKAPRPKRAPRRWAIGLLVPLVALSALHGYRGWTRDVELDRSVVLHASPRYWLPAARTLDQEERPHRLAVTAGAAQDADNWLLYPFLGPRLQNELHYVPPTRDGRTVDPGRQRDLVAAADFESWLERLRGQRIEAVISFRPATVEMAWMKRRPDLFTRLAGDGQSWGLYRLEIR